MFGGADIDLDVTFRKSDYPALSGKPITRSDLGL
jgi:hypothetical protein